MSRKMVRISGLAKENPRITATRAVISVKCTSLTWRAPHSRGSGGS